MKRDFRVCHLFGGVRALKIGKWQAEHGFEVHQILIEPASQFKSYWQGKIKLHQSKTLTRLYSKLSSKLFLSVFKSYLFLYFFYVPLLNRTIKDNKINIIHAHRHTGAAIAFLTTKLFRLNDTKIIFDYQDPWAAEELKNKNFVHRLSLKLYFKLERYLVHSSDLIVTQGQEQTDTLLKRHGGDPKKFIFTWNTSDHLLFRPSKDRGKIRKQYDLDNKIAILYLGSIVDYFGVHLIPEAAAKIVKNFPNVRFVMMGVIRDQNYWQKIKDRIKTLKLDQYFIEIYPKTKEEIPSLIASCDVGLVTHMRGSYICEIAIPTKLFEYMSSGLAVVSSDLPHITQFTIPNKAGIEFKANDPNSLVIALKTLLNNLKSIKAYGINSRKVVESKYNWNIEMAKLKDAYKNVVLH